MTQPTPTQAPSLNPNDYQPGMTPVPTPAPKPPTTLADADAELSRIRQQKLQAYYEWDQYRKNNPGVSGNDTTGQAYRQQSGKLSFPGPNAEGPTSEPKSLYDEDATRVFQKYWLLDQQDKELTAARKAGGFGPTEAGMSYVESEKLKQDEARREFTDAVDRIKALYSFQDQEGEWMQENAKANIETEKAVQSGLTSWSDSMVRPTYIPPGARQSDVIKPSIPKSVPPFYSMSEAVGLPGREGLGGGISGYSQGTGFDKLPSVPVANSQGGLKSVGGIDPEIAWLIGRPDVPVVLDVNLVPPLPPTQGKKPAPAAPQPPANPGFARLA